MGGSSSKLRPSSQHGIVDDETPQARFTAAIERDIERRQHQHGTVARLLLNNTTGEPIFKDIFEAFGSPLSEDDQDLYRVYLQSNLLEDTRKLCRQLQKLQSISVQSQRASIWDDSDHEINFYGIGEFKSTSTPQEAYNELMEALFLSDAGRQLDLVQYPPSNNSSCSPKTKYCQRASPIVNANARLLMQYTNPICKLWLSRTVQNLCILQKLHPIWHGAESVKCYDRNDVLRITSSDFRPEPHDLAGINLPFPVVTRMRIDGMDLEVHDIGGMPACRRRKYVHCFDHSDLFMFAAALSHYDQPVASTATKGNAENANRLAAAMEEFGYFLNRKAPSHRRNQTILMLTEKDIFAAKMQHSSLSEQLQFSDFQGNSLDGVQYITDKFKDHVSDKNWDVVQVAGGHNQCNLQFLLDSMRTILMTENLRRSGFLIRTGLDDLQEFYDSD